MVLFRMCFVHTKLLKTGALKVDSHDFVIEAGRT